LRKFYTFPKNLPLFAALGSNGVAFAILMGYFAGKRDGVSVILCKDKFREADFTDGDCVFQGMIVLFCALVASMWWLLIGVNLFLTIVLGKRKFRQTSSYIFYAFGWGVPSLAVIICLAAKKFEYSTGYGWCFVSDADDNAWELGLFYVPVLVITAVGTGCLSVIIFKIVQSSLQTRGFLSSGKKAKLPRETYRLVGFIILFLYIFSFIYAYRFDLISRKDKIEKSFEEYAKCVLKSQFAENPQKAKDSCEWKDKLNYGIYVLNIFNASIQGVLVFAFFGLTQDNFKFVKILILERRIASDQDIRENSTTTGPGSSVEMSVNRE